MRRVHWATALVLLSVLLTVGAVVAWKRARRTQSPAPPSSPADGDGWAEAEAATKRFRVPDGLHVDLVAAEPLLVNPVSFCFDERGRIYVAETHRLGAGVTDVREGHLDWVDEDLASRTVEDRVALLRRRLGTEADRFTRNHDQIRLLEFPPVGGRACGSKVFADGFNQIADGIGSGVLARGGRVWYTCIPHLWLLDDSRGAGRAEVRRPLHFGYGVHVGYAGHDLHGLRFGPDGKLYFSCGDRGFHVQTEGRTLSSPDSGAVLRCNPDGSELEIYATGLRNPQELAFDRYGNLFTCDNNSDYGDLARWVYVVPGGDSGWRIGYQFLDHPITCGPWQAEHLWEPEAANPAAYLVPPVANVATGPAGLTYHPGVALLPDRYQEHFFLADFLGGSGNSGIRAIAHKPRGASFELVADEQFWWSVLATDVDFGPDGALYLSDWVDGWAMPNKGRIYKLYDPRRRDDPLVAETQRLLAEGMTGRSRPELARLLGYADMRVRQEAQFALADQTAASTDILAEVARTSKDQVARLHAIWGLGQQGRTSARALGQLLGLLEDADAEVRGQAAKVLGEAGFAAAAGLLRGLLRDDSPRVRFFAALALARLGAPEALAPVCDLLQENADRDAYLRHAGVMALAAVRDESALLAAARDASPAVRLGVLLALRRRGSPEVGCFLDDPDPRLVLEAVRAINDVPIDAAQARLAALANRPGLTEPVLYRVLNANFRQGGAANASALAALAARTAIPQPIRVEALRELAAWAAPPGRDRVLGVWRPLGPRPGKPAADALRPVLPDLLRGPEPIGQETARAAAQLRLAEAAPLLRELVADPKGAAGVRVEALKALEALGDAHLEEVLRRALADGDVRLRIQGRRTLARLRPAEAPAELERALRQGSVRERQDALAALAELKAPEADRLLGQWLDQLLAGKVPPELQLDLLEAAQRRQLPELQAKLDRYEAARPRDDPLAAYQECLAGGDADAGRAIFFHKEEVACVRCHKVNGEGGIVGPDLSHIGGQKDRAYLLESIVDPNKRIAEGFETVTVVLRNGSVCTGVLRKEERGQMTLVTPDGEQRTIPTADIESRQRGPSAMPADLVNHLRKAELRDLVEFLAQLR